MAYKIIRSVPSTSASKDIFEITAVLDSADDLQALGNAYAPGSLAIVADAGLPTYVLNASGEWKVS